MARELLHIYGPFSIQSFGLAIACAITVFTILLLQHPKRSALISQDQLLDLLLTGTLVGFLGARILYIIGQWDSISYSDMLSIWNGGFSFLGGALSVLLIMPWIVVKKGIPLLPLADLICLFMPLLQAIARLGCLAAGCCYGAASDASWAIVYTDPESFAPCDVALHPAQLYSSAALLLLFLLLYFYAQRILKKPGQLAACYFIGIGLERFLIDFWRADQEYIPGLELISLHQLLALFVCGLGITVFMVSSLRHDRSAP